MTLSIVQTLIFLLDLLIIAEVHSTVMENQLYPVYRIPFKDLSDIPDRPTLSVCIQSFRYVISEQQVYLGIRANQTDFIYAEVDANYTGSNCILNNSTKVARKFMSFKSDEEFMFLINGCFIIDKAEFKGVLVLMSRTWSVEFLKKGLEQFGVPL